MSVEPRWEGNARWVEGRHTRTQVCVDTFQPSQGLMLGAIPYSLMHACSTWSSWRNEVGPHASQL